MIAPFAQKKLLRPILSHLCLHGKEPEPFANNA